MKNKYEFYWSTLDGEILIIELKKNEDGPNYVNGPFVKDEDNNIKLPFELVKEIIKSKLPVELLKEIIKSEEDI